MKQGWENLIGKEFSKEYMINLSKIITKERENKIIYPDSEIVFRIFDSISPANIKVVILGQDPYHDGSADGYAFSNSKNKDKVSPSLRNIFKELEKEYSILEPFHNTDPDLKRWVEQGVFLCNTILTVEKGKPLSHSGLGWELFTEKWLTELSENYKHIVYMLWGNGAKKFKKYINENNNLILEAKHPSPLSANYGGWFGCNHFKLSNAYLKDYKKEKITWI